MATIDDYSKAEEPFITVTAVGEGDRNSRHVSDSRGPRRRDAWRTTVTVGAVAAAVVLLANIAILIWVEVGFKPSGGVATVFTGSCGTSKRAIVFADLAVNIFSTILLAASNCAGQILSSPSRSEVEKAHTRGKWLNIGVPSLGNMSLIPAWRSWLWVLLLSSSLPLHLLYNSVIFYTASAVDYQAAIVTNDFVNGGWWNKTRAQSSQNIFPPANMGQLEAIQANVGQLQNLSNADCIRAYATSMVESQWRNVLVVTSLTLNDSLVDVFQHTAAKYSTDIGWPCQGENYYYGAYGGAAPCDTKTLIANADSWTIPNVQQCQHCGVWPNDRDCFCESFIPPIQYCLAEPFPSYCTVSINTSILAVVIVCNLLKILAMIITVRSNHFPLATVGDAIASFLSIPDPTVQGYGPLSAQDVKRGLWKPQHTGTVDESQSISSRRVRWGRSASLSRWIPTIFLCAAVWGGALALLISGMNSAKTNANASTGLTLDTSDLFHDTNSSKGHLIGNILLANLPQILVSLCYLFYNNVLTCMLLASEYASYASVRKPLRVTNPHGLQTSTHRLQLPYIYSLPLMAAMAILHWLISRSLYLVQIDIYDNNGNAIPDRNISDVGYQIKPLIAALAVGGVLILALFGLSFRRLDRGIPMAGSCSVALSAACSGNDEVGAELDRLKYGVLVRSGWEDATRRRRVGFWSAEVASVTGTGDEVR